MVALISDFYGNTAQVLAIAVLALVWNSDYFEQLRNSAFSDRTIWKRVNIRLYSTLVALVIIVEIGLCLTVLSGLFTNTTIWQLTVGAGVAFALITLFFRMFTRIWGLDAPPQTHQHSASVPEQIAQLDALRDKGTLTDKEFADKKSILLSQIR